MQQTPNYQRRSRELLTKAYQELDEDLGQASEKGWGAAAEMVKAVAEQRGWEHRHHRLLTNAVSRLRRETGDNDLTRLFGQANALHINFYEDAYFREDVELLLQDVERFVDKVESLITQDP